MRLVFSRCALTQRHLTWELKQNTCEPCNASTHKCSCNGRYSPPLDHLLTGTDSLVLGDFNAHHSLWHSGTTDARGNQLADSVSTSSFAVLNTDSPTRCTLCCRGVTERDCFRPTSSSIHYGQEVCETCRWW